MKPTIKENGVQACWRHAGFASGWSVLLAKITLLMVPVLLAVGLLFILLPRNPDSYFLGFMLKHDLCRKAESPKIVLLGGSNLAFGVDSEELARVCGMNVVNMGLHGGLGVSLLLDSVEPDGLRRGDIVILSMEYGSFRTGVYQGNVAVAELLFEDPRAWRCMGPEHVPVVCENLGRLCWLRLCKVLGRTRLEADRIYNAHAFNACGDVVTHLSDGDTVVDPLPAKIAPGRNEVDPWSAAMLAVQKFVRRANERGVRVYIVPPCYREQEYAVNREAIARHWHVLRDMFPGITLSSPENFVFCSDMCFDTEYHLNRRGKALRTKRLAETILAANALAGDGKDF